MTSNEKLIKLIQAEIDGKEIQISGSGQWTSKHLVDTWDASRNYRIKPKPREWWVNMYGANCTCMTFHESKQSAEKTVGIAGETIHVREVLDDG